MNNEMNHFERIAIELTTAKDFQYLNALKPN